MSEASVSDDAASPDGSTDPVDSGGSEAAASSALPSRRSKRSRRRARRRTTAPDAAPGADRAPARGEGVDRAQVDPGSANRGPSDAGIPTDNRAQASTAVEDEDSGGLDGGRSDAGAEAAPGGQDHQHGPEDGAGSTGSDSHHQGWNLYGDASPQRAVHRPNQRFDLGAVPAAEVDHVGYGDGTSRGRPGFGRSDSNGVEERAAVGRHGQLRAQRLPSRILDLFARFIRRLLAWWLPLALLAAVLYWSGVNYFTG